MKKYVLLFRMDILSKEKQVDKKQMEVYMQQWMLWINEIASKNQLADGGNHFSKEGRVLKPNHEITKSPYVAENISLAGYIIILAKNMSDATLIAEKCPILNGEGTSVEIREISSPGE